MTSISNKMGSVYFEFPDFGFGPASTSIELISRLTSEFECHIISTGTALALAKSAFPNLDTYDIDTFEAASWPKFRAHLPPPRIIISNTNLPFAAWAIDEGYVVGVTDTLYWMWDEFPESLRRSLFYAAQYYFGASQTAAAVPADLKAVYVRPLINESRWMADRPPIQRGSALISFGGMKLPLDVDLPATYVGWILNNVLPFLFESTCVSEISIVGGLSNLHGIVPQIWRDDPRVHVRGFLAPPAYRDELLSTEYQFLTPGLTSMYEAQAANISPFFLPGFNMSQVLQAFHLRHTAKYEHVAELPEAARIYKDLASCSEENGVKMISQIVRRTILEEPTSPQFLIGPLGKYIETRKRNNLSDVFPSLIADSKALQPIDQIIRRPLLDACAPLSTPRYGARQ